MPPRPDRTYVDSGWQGWGHWLSAEHFLPFGEALAKAQSLGLASVTEWRVLCKEGMCPSKVPAYPHKVYKDGGWQGWVHWLGTGNTTPGKSRTRVTLHEWG